MLGRVGEVVLAADDVGHGHRGVVDDDREVVERRPVAADDHEVPAERAGVDLHVAADQVVERDDPLPDPEADDRLATLRLPVAPLGRGEVGAPADVVRRQVGRFLGRPVGRQLLRRAVAVVGLVLGQQPLGGRGVERQALHLAVRPVRAAGGQAADLRPLVPVQAQPVQAVEDVLLIGDRAARGVGVLQAQHERPAMPLGEQVVVERRPGRADMERAGGARRDAAADGGRHAGVRPWAHDRPVQPGQDDRGHVDRRGHRGGQGIESQTELVGRGGLAEREPGRRDQGGHAADRCEVGQARREEQRDGQCREHPRDDRHGDHEGPERQHGRRRHPAEHRVEEAATDRRPGLRPLDPAAPTWTRERIRTPRRAPGRPPPGRSRTRAKTRSQGVVRTRDEERPRGGTRLLPRLVMRRLRHGRRSGWVPARATACPAGSSSAGRMARPRRAARPTRRGGSTPARPSTRRRRRIGCRRRSRRPTGPGDGSRRRSAWSCPGSAKRWCRQPASFVAPAPCPCPCRDRSGPLDHHGTSCADQVYESLVGSRPDVENGSGRRRCRFVWGRDPRAGRGPAAAVFPSPAGDAWGWPWPRPVAPPRAAPPRGPAGRVRDDVSARTGPGR